MNKKIFNFSTMTKPTALILGGCGFIGRNLVQYLVELQVCSKIRVVDKVLPATAYLTESQRVAFEQVEFKQGNLVNPASIARAFDMTDGESKGGHWDYVFNVAGETKYSQPESVYDEKVYLLSINCAKEAARRNVGVFIETSTGQVYDADKKPSKEEGKLKPWTLLAKAKLKAEQEISKLSGLNYVIVRPAIVYGVGDFSHLTSRLVVAAVYKELKEEMKFLWTKDLRINTVHVQDVVRAYLELARAANDDFRKSEVIGQTFNLADHGNCDQESVNAIIRNIFGIKTGFQGTIISNLAKLNLSDVTEDINEKHLQPWSDICKRHGVKSTPLTPYLDQELLYNNSLSIDGSKIEQVLGFKYEVPAITETHIRQVLDGFIEVGIFPKNFV